MVVIRALVPALVAGGALVVSPAILAQAVAPARPAVDARSMLPSIATPDAVAPPAGKSGLTRDQRKDAALKARQEGTLKPAGEGAELRDDSATALAAQGKTQPVVRAVSPPPLKPPGAVATPPAKVAANAARAQKKGAAKKAAVRPAPSKP